jgi:hypothetical protein
MGMARLLKTEQPTVEAESCNVVNNWPITALITVGAVAIFGDRMAAQAPLVRVAAVIRLRCDYSQAWLLIANKICGLSWATGRAAGRVNGAGIAGLHAATTGLCGLTPRQQRRGQN